MDAINEGMLSPHHTEIARLVQKGIENNEENASANNPRGRKRRQVLHGVPKHIILGSLRDTSNPHLKYPST